MWICLRAASWTTRGRDRLRLHPPDDRVVADTPAERSACGVDRARFLDDDLTDAPDRGLPAVPGSESGALLATTEGP